MVQTGKIGTLKVNGAAPTDIRNWQYDRTSDLKAFRSSSTGGETGRVAGNGDLTGSFEVYNNVCPVTVGSRVLLALYTASADTPATGYAIISGASVMVGIESGDIIGYRISWGGDYSSGAWTGVA